MALPRGIRSVILALALVVSFAGGIVVGYGLKGADSPATDFEVARVVDGDTIVVFVGTGDEKVRLLGVDTPESVDPRRPVQCFGREAAEHARQLMAGKRVRLEADTSAGDRDSFGRMLRYVYLEDGTLVNEALIRDGYAHEYTYRKAYSLQLRFKEAELEAKQNGRGLWSPATCNGSP